MVYVLVFAYISFHTYSHPFIQYKTEGVFIVVNGNQKCLSFCNHSLQYTSQKLSIVHDPK